MREGLDTREGFRKLGVSESLAATRTIHIVELVLDDPEGHRVGGEGELPTCDQARGELLGGIAESPESNRILGCRFARRIDFARVMTGHRESFSFEMGIARRYSLIVL